MGVSRRRSLAAAAAVIVTLSVAACGGDEPRAPASSDVTIFAPAEQGSQQTIALQGTERGRGRVGVVLAHMLGSTQSAWILLADELVAEDFHVLTFDFRGHGLSGGSRDPSTAALDLEAAAQKLVSLGASKIFIVGASMGGTAAVVVAFGRLLEGVVSISGPLRIQGLDAFPLVDRLDEPSLFIAGEKDGEYTEAAKQFAGRAPEPKRLQIISGSGAHGTDLLSDEKTRQRVIDLIVDFLIANRG